jgi:hypothetical protein
MDNTQSVTPRNLDKLDKSVNLGHLLFSALMLLTVVIGGYANLKSTDSAHEERIKQLEIQYQRIDGKSDKILDKLETLTILVANKQDRSNK